VWGGEKVTIKNFRPKTLSSALNELDRLAFSSPLVVFRGHKVSSWRLESTLARHTRLYPVHLTHSLDDMLSHFILNLRSVGAHLPFPEGDRRSRLEYGRHYAVPSPLIDFSYSPLVALFFAFNGVRVRVSKSNDLSVIYALNVDSLAMLWARQLARDPIGIIDTKKLNIEANWFRWDADGLFDRGYSSPMLKFMAFPASWNIRMLRQMGAFIYDSIEYGQVWTDLEDFIEKEADILGDSDDPPTLTKIYFRHAWGGEIFQRLELSGITGTRLLDDHEGAAADVVNSYNYNRKLGYAWDLQMPIKT
jgi:hypothetical protein